MKTTKKERPSFTTATGYVLQYRTLAQETLPRLEAAARLTLAESKPNPPKQRVETGPDTWNDVPNPHDAQYQEALEAWELAVQEQRGMLFLTLCEDYALIYEIDQEEVAAFKAISAATGDTSVADMTDKQIFLWRIVLPTPDDQFALYGKLFGGLTEEAIQAQKGSFLSQLQEATTQSSARTPTA